MTRPGVKKHKRTNNHSVRRDHQSNCVNTSINSRRHLLTPMENRDAKVAVQYSRPYFSRPKVKRKNSGRD